MTSDTFIMMSLQWDQYTLFMEKLSEPDDTFIDWYLAINF